MTLNLRWALKEPITIRAIELDVMSIPGAVVVVGIIDARTRVSLATVFSPDVKCAIPEVMLRDSGPMVGPLKRVSPDELVYDYAFGTCDSEVERCIPGTTVPVPELCGLPLAKCPSGLVCKEGHGQ